MRATAALAGAVADGLARAGTRRIFGMPGGGANLDLVGACEAAGLRFVLAHTETAAAMMAAVDGELTGAPGACLVTRGPGIASAVNGAAQALLDRQPMLLISDAVPAADAPRVSHQRIDQEALLRPVTKWSAPLGLDDAERTLDAAIEVALRPPQGPVHLSFQPGAAPARPEPVPEPPAGDRDSAAALLQGSRRPVLAIGVGARGHAEAVRSLLAHGPWPALATYKAKGIVAEGSSAYAGMLTGATIEGPLLASADLVLAVGLDPVELIPAAWPYAAPIVSLAAWPTAETYFEPDAELVGDLDELLAFAASHLSAPAAPVEDVRERAAVRVPAAGLTPHEVVDTARALAPAGTIATVDAGAHMLVAMPLWQVEGPGEALISSGLATMSFALPAAIAAALARPGQRVVCFTGDGGLAMTLGELETLARLELPVVVVVLDDAALSLIEVKQSPEGHGGRGAVRFRDVDYAAVARACGVAAVRAASRVELGGALRGALGRPGPTLVDAIVDPRGYPAVLEAIRG